MVADDVPDPVCKDLRATPRHRIDARSLHPLQRLGDRHLAALRKKRDLDHRERLDVNLRKPLLQAAHQIHEVLERKIRMQTADDMELRHRLCIACAGSLPRLLKRHRVGSCLALLTAERTQPARRNTDVRRIDMTIYVEVSNVPMQLLAHKIGKPTNRQNVAAAIERQPIIEGQPLSGQNLLSDRFQRSIVRLKGMSGPREGRLRAHASILILCAAPA